MIFSGVKGYIMREWNLDPDSQHYYSQNNNVLKPSIRCKPTSTICGLAIQKHTLPSGGFKQPEDNLTAMMETTYGKDSPEDWAFIQKAINEHFNPIEKPVIGPRWNWSIQEALFGITRGIPFIASTWLTKGGHVVTIIGFTSNDESTPLNPQEIILDEVKEIIIHDPYGDRTSGIYDKTKSGKNNRYPAEYFIQNLWRGTGIQIKGKS
jgi:hypothetical protein